MFFRIHSIFIQLNPHIHVNMHKRNTISISFTNAGYCFMISCVSIQKKHIFIFFLSLVYQENTRLFVKLLLCILKSLINLSSCVLYINACFYYKSMAAFYSMHLLSECMSFEKGTCIQIIYEPVYIPSHNSFREIHGSIFRQLYYYTLPLQFIFADIFYWEPQKAPYPGTLPRNTALTRYFTPPSLLSGQMRKTTFPTICSSATQPMERLLESMDTSR